MKFIASFSTGKDSMLALHRMISQGHEPMGLLVMYHPQQSRSWVHGAKKEILEEIARALNIPLFCCEASPKEYEQAIEQTLQKAKELGAQACIFGDIDLEGHRQWNQARCQKVGLQAIMPLWQEDRKALVQEVVDLGYTCILKCVDSTKISAQFLGKALDREIINHFKTLEIDLCGENGEYHTLVVNGPLFQFPVEYQLGQVVQIDKTAAIEVLKKEN